MHGFPSVINDADILCEMTKTSTTRLLSRELTLTLDSSGNTSKVQPSWGAFIFIKLNDGEQGERLPCQVFSSGENKTALTVRKPHRRTRWAARTCINAHGCSVLVGACEMRRPPPLRENRKLETIQRLHAGFSSKLFPQSGPSTRSD